MPEKNENTGNNKRPWIRSRKPLYWLTTIIILYTLAGFLLAPYLLKNQLLDFVQNELERGASIVEVKINPYALSLTIRGFNIHEPDGVRLTGFNEFHINFTLASLIHQAWTFEEFRLIRPYLNVTVRPDGAVNLLELGKNLETETEPAEAPGTQPMRVIFHNINIDSGELEYLDQSHPGAYSATLKPLNLKLDNFSTVPEREGHYGFTATLGDGGRLQWSGHIAVAPLRSSGTLEVTGLKVDTLWRYIQHQVSFVADEGVLGFKGEYTLNMHPDNPAIAIDGASLELAGFTIKSAPDTAPLLSLPLLQLEGGTVRWPEQSATIDRIQLSDGVIRATLDQQGEFDWQRLAASAPTESAGTAQTDQPDEEAGEPWRVKIGDFLLKNLSVALSDQSALPVANLTLDALDLQLSNLDSAPQSLFDLDLKTKVNNSGLIHVNGQAGAQPPTSDLQVEIKDLLLKPFQPYLSRIARLKLRAGELNLDGKLSYNPGQVTGAENGAAPNLSFNGNVNINGFDSRDTLTGERFLAWKQLQLEKLSYEQSPDRLAIGAINSDELYAKITIAADGNVNIDQILSTEGDSEKDSGTQSEDTATLPVEIGRIRLKAASANFADLSLKPQFATAIHSLNGEIAGLSSANPARADVDIKGKVDAHGTVTISGQINPLSEDKYTDLDVRFGNIELTTFTPYSGKFAGYVIDKGKLSLDLNYQISQQKLVGKNKIVLNQLTLGNNTNSPDAISLPLKLAIALMKDANGVIDIDLPVEGNLDDPEFRYGHLIGKALFKLITGIIASPFKLLGNMLGVDGASLEYVEFDPGSVRLSDAEREKTMKIAEALKMRPVLNLEVRGSYENEQDGLALKTAKLENSLFMRMGDSAAVNRSYQEAQEQALDILSGLYTEQFGEEQRGQLEAQFVLNPEEAASKKKRWLRKKSKPEIDKPAFTAALRNQLIEAQPLEQGELRLLAQERAKAIMDIVVLSGEVAGERIFILEPQVNDENPGVLKAHMTLNAK